MSRRLIRQGVPGISRRHPLQRMAVLSATMVVMVTPEISMDAIVAGPRRPIRLAPPGAVPAHPAPPGPGEPTPANGDPGDGDPRAPKGIRTPDLHLERVAS